MPYYITTTVKIDKGVNPLYKGEVLDKLLHEEVMSDPPRSKVDHDYEAMKSIFKLCVEMRNFEITQLTHRNNFFMIFQGVLLSGVVQSSHMFPVVSFLV